MADPRITLAIAAATLGFLHTLLGPDHYLPFVIMGRTLRWSRAKTLGVTLACGVGHVLSSLLLGAVGIALGAAATRLQIVEAYRGRMATWFLIAFGLMYGAWGLRRAFRGKPHTHVHAHMDGTVHAHAHTHEGEHSHPHLAEADAGSSPAARVTPWVLFTIFVLGPCGPLIPLLMVPAAQGSAAGVVLVLTVFGLVTLATMSVVVLSMQAGLSRLPLGSLERYAHALAGATVALCGLAIQYFGL